MQDLRFTQFSYQNVSSTATTLYPLKIVCFIYLKSIKVTEKIAAETAGREAAVKAKEKIEGKYEDLKKKSQEKLAEQSTGSEALQAQIDGLKQLSNKMEEEIENNKIQKMKDDKKLEEIERVTNYHYL